MEFCRPVEAAKDGGWAPQWLKTLSRPGFGTAKAVPSLWTFNARTRRARRAAAGDCREERLLATLGMTAEGPLRRDKGFVDFRPVFLTCADCDPIMDRHECER